MASRTLTVNIVGDASKLKKATAQAGADTDKLGSKIKSAAIGLGVAALAKGAFDQAEEARKVAGQTAAVIKSTGGAAGVSSKQVDDLATSISKAAGVDDELVASAENMLLTFTGIKNVGVDKVFDRTTQAAVDMAAATGTDAVSAAKMLGKALNDPTAGVSKLTRAGVVFTEQQKEQIKTFQKSGEVAKAQGVILAEVEKEFGGSAAATATEADKARVAWENFLESAGTAAAPVLNNAAKALGGLADGFNALPQPAQQGVIVATAGALAWARYGDTLTAAGSKAVQLGKDLIVPSSAVNGLGSNARMAGSGMSGLAVSLGSAVALTAGVEELFQAIEKGRTAGENADSLAVALDRLGKSGKAGGELTQSYGKDLGKLKEAFDRLDVTNAEKVKLLFGGGLLNRNTVADMRAAEKSVDNLDKQLADLAKRDPKAAAASFAYISKTLQDQGVPLSTIKGAFELYGDAARDAGIEAEKAAKAPNPGLDEQIGKLGKLRSAILSAADARLSRSDAAAALPSAEADRLNALGAYNTALGNYSRSGSLEDQQAVLRARQALYDATKRVTDLQVSAAGATDDATKSLQIQTEQFQVTADSLRPGDPLRANLAGLIADLDRYRDRVNLTNIAEDRLADDRAAREAGMVSGRYGSPAPAPGAAPSSNAGANGAPIMFGPIPIIPGRGRSGKGGTGKGEGTVVNGNVIIQPQGESATQTMRDLAWHVRAGSGG